MKTPVAGSIGMASFELSRGGWGGSWQWWAPRAALAWSLIYAALGLYWAVSGHGFPYIPAAVAGNMGPAIERFGPRAAWLVVMTVGIPAAAMGAAMLRPVRCRALRPILIAGGGLLAAVLLLLMTGLNLLVLFGYIPYVLRGLFTDGGIGHRYLEGLIKWTTIHEVLCLIGGFLWLAATVCYGRLSRDACLYCGRRDGPEGRDRPSRAVRWGRMAVYVSMAAPAFYAVTRYAWALGFPLGMSEEHLRRGQESGLWTSGLFLANFGLAGALLTLGLVQRWGEAFPRWMIGLAGRRVPVALAVVPASLVSALLVVGGFSIWSGLNQMIANAASVAGGAQDEGIIGQIVFVLGPTLLFPVWGAALAVATLCYYYRRRGPCAMCGRVTSG